MLKRFNGLAFLIAAALVLSYLVARPHLGTVNVLYIYSTTNGIPDKTGAAIDRYPTRAECDKRTQSDSEALGTRLFETCEPQVTLLWGW